LEGVINVKMTFGRIYIVNMAKNKISFIGCFLIKKQKILPDFGPW
jgi:hypothetical protein